MSGFSFLLVTIWATSSKNLITQCYKFALYWC